MYLNIRQNGQHYYISSTHRKNNPPNFQLFFYNFIWFTNHSNVMSGLVKPKSPLWLPLCLKYFTKLTFLSPPSNTHLILSIPIFIHKPLLPPPHQKEKEKKPSPYSGNTLPPLFAHSKPPNMKIHGFYSVPSVKTMYLLIFILFGMCMRILKCSEKLW